MIFKGCAIRLVTPFSDTNEVDFDKLEKLLDKQLGLGAAAIIVGGNNGEFLTMSDEEISSLIDFVVKKVDKKIPVLAQTGFNDTRRSIILGIKANPVSYTHLDVYKRQLGESSKLILFL